MNYWPPAGSVKNKKEMSLEEAMVDARLYPHGEGMTVNRMREILSKIHPNSRAVYRNGLEDVGYSIKD